MTARSGHAMDAVLRAAVHGMRRSRRLSYMLSGWIEMFDLPRGAGGTTCLTIGCPDDFVAVRLGFPNLSPEPWRMTRIIGRASSSYNDYVTPTGDAPWVAFTQTFEGRDSDRIVTEPGAPAGFTVAGRPGASHGGDSLGPHWTWTDWAPISSLPLDAGAGLRVLMLRALVPSEQTVCYAVGQLRGMRGNENLNSGFDCFVGGIKFDIDRVTDPSFQESAITWVDNQLAVGSLFPMVQFMTKRPGVTGIVTGDSHQQGTSTTEQHSSFLYRSATRAMKRTTDRTPIGFVNCSAGGLTSADFFQRFETLLEPVRPSYAILPGWSFNDETGGVHADQSAIDLFFARLMFAAESCAARGILPIFITPFPRDAESMGEAQAGPWRWLRREIMRLANAGAVVFDTTSVLAMRDGDVFTGTYLPGMTDDRRHPNDAGHQAVSDMLRPFFDVIA